MFNKANEPEDFQILPSQIRLEFLEALLQPEDSTYPWNPTAQESEEYFLQREEELALKDLLADELAIRSQAFYNQLDTLWNSLASYYNCDTKSNIVAKLQESLQSVFAARVPQEWLQAIAHKASEIVNSQHSMAEQLVKCVQGLLPTWGEEDLFVLARPYAYAMRSNEPQKTAQTVLESVSEGEWANLSEIEQARISLAIAYYALGEIKSFQTQA
jgi:hypothetical protein